MRRPTCVPQPTSYCIQSHTLTRKLDSKRLYPNLGQTVGVYTTTYSPPTGNRTTRKTELGTRFDELKTGITQSKFTTTSSRRWVRLPRSIAAAPPPSLKREAEARGWQFVNLLLLFKFHHKIIARIICKFQSLNKHLE